MRKPPLPIRNIYLSTARVASRRARGPAAAAAVCRGAVSPWYRMSADMAGGALPGGGLNELAERLSKPPFGHPVMATDDFCEQHSTHPGLSTAQHSTTQHSTEHSTALGH